MPPRYIVYFSKLDDCSSFETHKLTACEMSVEFLVIPACEMDTELYCLHFGVYDSLLMLPITLFINIRIVDPVSVQ